MIDKAKPFQFSPNKNEIFNEGVPVEGLIPSQFE
jgi:hypothetical protein